MIFSAALDVLRALVASLWNSFQSLRPTLLPGTPVNDEVQLPPEIWANILDFCTYDTVARMASVSPFFLHDVMPLIRFLYLDDQRAITVQQARRFQNGRVQEIIIDCLFRGFLVPSDGFGNTPEFQTMKWARQGRLASFLSTMPASVHAVFFGKGKHESKTQILARLGLKESQASSSEVSSFYVPVKSFEVELEQSFRAGTDGYYGRCRGNLVPTERSEEVFKEVVATLCDAYSAGSMPQTMHLYGLPAIHDHFQDCSWGNGYCSTCDRMFATFPLDPLLSMKKSPAACYFPNRLGSCMDRKVIGLLKRPGALELIQAKQQEFYCDLLQQCEVDLLDMEDGSDSMAITYEYHVVDAMHFLKERGCDPAKVTNAREVVLNAFKRALGGVAYEHFLFNDEYVGPWLIMEKAYNDLLKVGYTGLDEQEFPVMRESECAGIWPLSG